MDFGHFGLKLGIFACLSEIGNRFLPFLRVWSEIGRENRTFWSKMGKSLNKRVAHPHQKLFLRSKKTKTFCK